MAHREPNGPPLDKSLQKQAPLLRSYQHLGKYNQHQQANPHSQQQTQRGNVQQDLALQPYSQQQQQQQQYPSQDKAQNTPLAYVTEMYPMPGPPDGIQSQEVGQELRSQSQSQSQQYAPQTQVNSSHKYSPYPPTATNSHQKIPQQSTSEREKQIPATITQPPTTIVRETHHHHHYHNHNREEEDEPDWAEFCECLCHCCCEIFKLFAESGDDSD